MTIHFNADLRPVTKGRHGMLHWLTDPAASGFIISYDPAGNQVLISNFDVREGTPQTGPMLANTRAVRETSSRHLERSALPSSGGCSHRERRAVRCAQLQTVDT